MKDDSILRGYTSRETALEVKGYPWGFRFKTSIFYWIESKKNKGDRFCSYTIDPKTGRACATKAGTYSNFLYMVRDPDTGYVKTEGLDSYDREHFQNRFPFLIERYGEEYLNEAQKFNIRGEYAARIKLSYPWDKVKYKPESQEAFKQWTIATIKHILNCEFKDIVDHPEPPVQDNPTGEVEVTVTTYQPV